MNGMNGIPALYDYQNLNMTMQAPNTIHCKNTFLAWYFKRYLIQKIMALYKFEGLPKNWAKNYFLYTLFCFGHVAVIETDRFGIIPQHCSLSGRNVQYQPSFVKITNPLIKEPKTAEIGKQAALIMMQPDYGGCWDIVEHYADMMAISVESAAINLMNSKLAYVFATKSKAGAESFKLAYDEIASGNPITVLDKDLFNEDNTPNWLMFNQNLKGTYIAGEILEDLTKWDARFNTDIGVPNVNVAKESGVSAREVDANNVDTATKFQLWLETIQDGLEETNRLYGTNISVRPRFKQEYQTKEKGGIENGDAINFNIV